MKCKDKVNLGSYGENERCRVMPYSIHGVKLYGVEYTSGYTVCYLNTMADAQSRCDELNAEANK